MYLKNKTVSAYNSSQIAYPVGPEKDSYTITSWFTQDINTLEITVIHELIKNWSCDEKDPTIKYKEGKRFRETLYKGTYKECVEYFKSNVLNTQKEWIRDEKLNYIYPEN